MSLFRFAKYSTLLFFLGKYKHRLFRVVAVLLFVTVTSLLYQDVVEYLHREHPGSVVYALTAKILIVYGALAFVLWQFRPQKKPAGTSSKEPRQDRLVSVEPNSQHDRLSQLENLGEHDQLSTRYEQLLKKEKEPR